MVECRMPQAKEDHQGLVALSPKCLCMARRAPSGPQPPRARCPEGAPPCRRHPKRRAKTFQHLFVDRPAALHHPPTERRLLCGRHSLPRARHTHRLSPLCWPDPASRGAAHGFTCGSRRASGAAVASRCPGASWRSCGPGPHLDLAPGVDLAAAATATSARARASPGGSAACCAPASHGCTPCCGRRPRRHVPAPRAQQVLVCLCAGRGRRRRGVERRRPQAGGPRQKEISKAAATFKCALL